MQWNFITLSIEKWIDTRLRRISERAPDSHHPRSKVFARIASMDAGQRCGWSLPAWTCILGWDAPDLDDILFRAMIVNEVADATQEVFQGTKLEAVKLVTERGMRAAQVARDMDIGANVVSRWVREARADKEHVFPGRGHQKPENAEIARLKRELARTKAKRDILKKMCGLPLKSKVMFSDPLQPVLRQCIRPVCEPFWFSGLDGTRAHRS